MVRVIKAVLSAGQAEGEVEAGKGTDLPTRQIHIFLG